MQIICSACDSTFQVQKLTTSNATICIDVNCATWDQNLGTCLSCNSGFIYNSQTATCGTGCPSDMVNDGTNCVCNSTSYFDTFQHICWACTTIDKNCEACIFDPANYQGNCTQCANGSTLATSTHTYCDVCGDGLIGISEQCEDGNTASGDGCSSSC